MTGPRLARVTVSVHDLDRALALYAGVLGLTPLYAADDMAMLAFPGEPDPAAADATTPQLLLHRRPPTPSAAGVAVSIAVDDVDAATLAAQAVGAQVVDPPSDQPWGERQAVLTDADGHILCLVSPLPAAPRDRP